MNWRASILLVALAATACTWAETPPLHVTGVSPQTTITRGVGATITVMGGGFVQDAVVDFDDPARSAVCIPLRVELRATGRTPVPLHHLLVVSASELRARLLGDAGKVLWDVVVIGDDGREATLPGALNVDNCAGATNTECNDDEPCTFDATFGTPEDGIDKCVGNSFCSGATTVPDGTSCRFACVAGGRVDGVCLTGVCVPEAGLCDPPPACTP